MSIPQKSSRIVDQTKKFNKELLDAYLQIFDINYDFASNVNEWSFLFVYFTLAPVYKFLGVYILNPNQDNTIKVFFGYECFTELLYLGRKTTVILPSRGSPLHSHLWI